MNTSRSAGNFLFYFVLFITCGKPWRERDSPLAPNPPTGHDPRMVSFFSKKGTGSGPPADAPPDSSCGPASGAAPAGRGEAAHIALGRRGENAACAFLADAGLRIHARNWRPTGRSAGLELDIIGEDKGELVFVEVKSRQSRGASGHAFSGGSGFETTMHDPLSAFTAAKRRTLVKAARLFLEAGNLWDKSCRFDLVCVTFFPDETFRVEHHTHVIEFDESVGGGNTSWQPW